MTLEKHHPLIHLTPDPHQHLPRVRPAHHVEERVDRVLDAVDRSLAY